METNQPRTMTGFSELLIWILPSVASLFIATGYIIEVSFQEFLGVFVEFEETTYLWETVKFGLDVIEVLYQFIVRHIVFGAISFLGFIIILACYFFVRVFRVLANKILEWQYAILILFILSLFLCQIILFWIPSAEIDDVLVKPAIFDRPFNSSRAKDIWKDIYCSRMEHKECPDTQENHKNALKDLFAQNLVVWLLILSSGVFVILRLSNGNPTFLFWKWGRNVFVSLTVVLVIVSYIGLPYTYAKLSRSTDFRDAIIHYHVMKEQIPLSSFESLPELTASNNKPNISQSLDDYILPVHGYILGKNQDELTIFSQEEHYVWYIPRSTIRLVKVKEHGDVLKEHMSKSKKDKDKTDAPPPG